MLRNEKGITLASLVVTIIVLLIIASVATVSGLDTVDYIKFNNAKAQFQTMQSHVDSWYEEYKNNEEILSYGTTDLSNLDVTKVSNTLYDEETNGSKVGNYRFFSSIYIQDTLNIDGISYDFFIDIENRSVLLYGGIKYQGKMYYSAEDFEIKNIHSEEISSDVSFETVIEDGSIIIYNIRFLNDMNISKYSVQYKLDEEDNWITLTSDMKRKYIYEYQNEYGNIEERIDSNAWYIAVDMPSKLIDKEFDVRITTASNEVKSEIKDVTVNWKGVVTKDKRILTDNTNQKTITVPKGFYILDYSNNAINDGVVVVAPDGSEFVWVPVEEPIYDNENENASKIPVSSTEGSLNGNTYTPMAIEVEGEYKSLLYNFDSTSGAYLRYGSDENFQGTTDTYIEPEVLSDSSDGDFVLNDETKGIALLKDIIKLEGTDDEIKEQWESQLQNEFNEMINCVYQNKGFYIGRYETSLDELNNAQSKAGKKPASGASSSARTWYGLYQKAKEYSSKNSLTEFVGSSMTWGNQYDQMMIWFMNNNIDITLESPINEEGITIVRNPTINKVTGPSEDNSWYDKINNIYDLLGGMREWSIQSYKYKYRVTVGGYYTNQNDTIYKLTSRISFVPTYSGSDKVSTRITLYVK